ncbi:hypothetical protein PAXINDRAFT_158698 [Paxillus involutus ATCC 200175]|uniref:Uncharacterized protein n=1 Tax=Paxillus involutus ATCC 200175 TaxID=664439 RepID=A0A0C9T5F1_PAXIN|nr:hypothetical protein PAXINDRAFT_158698 [Paxillus involutus ATCC 200175]
MLKRVRASVLCFLLHGFLAILHFTLLALYVTHTEHCLVIPLGTKSNIASTAVTIAMQSFITAPATHDLSLWCQWHVRSSIVGTVSIALYIGSIAMLHVTTSTLLSLRSFNGTTTVSVPTSPAISDLSTCYDAYGWGDASSVTRLLGWPPETTIVGVNRTLYDVLLDTSGTGNTTVNATTFEHTGNPDHSAGVTAGYGGNETFAMLLVPMCCQRYPFFRTTVVERIISWLFWGESNIPTHGPYMLFYSTFPIVDSVGNLGLYTNTTVMIWDNENRTSFTLDSGQTPALHLLPDESDQSNSLNTETAGSATVEIGVA